MTAVIEIGVSNEPRRQGEGSKIQTVGFLKQGLRGVVLSWDISARKQQESSGKEGSQGMSHGLGLPSDPVRQEHLHFIRRSRVAPSRNSRFKLGLAPDGDSASMKDAELHLRTAHSPAAFR